ncbi:MAG: hypothetical protein ABI318_23080 [Chthoniobacteraceae bacterium]
MKRALLSLVIAAALAGTGAILRSQDAAPAPAPEPVAPIQTGPPLQMLKNIRDANAKLLEKQAATLQKLDEMEKTAEQLKIFGKRS